MLPLYYIALIVGLMVLGVVVWAIWRVRSAFDKSQTAGQKVVHTYPEGINQLVCYELGMAGLGYLGWWLLF